MDRCRRYGERQEGQEGIDDENSEVIVSCPDHDDGTLGCEIGSFTNET